MAVTLSLFAGAGAQFFDNNGVILSGGKVYTYAAGTTTPRATYTTNSDAAFHTNPIVLDAAGRIPNGGEIWLQLGVGYKFVLKTSMDVLIATYDNIPSSAQPPAANDADSIMYEQGYTVTAGSFVVGKIYRIAFVGTTDFTLIGAVNNAVGTHFIATGAGTGTGTAELSQTVETKLREYISAGDFGVVGDGVVDDTVAIQAAINGVSAGGGGVLYFTVGQYKLTSTITLRPGVSIIGEQKGAFGTPSNSPGVSFVRAFSTGNIFYSPSSQNIVSVNYENFCIIGNKATFPGTNANGIVIELGNNIIFREVWVDRCPSSGFVIGQGANSFHNYFYNCYAFFCGAVGYAVQSDWMRFIDCWADGNYIGIEFPNNAYCGAFAHIERCHFEEFELAAIALRGNPAVGTNGNNEIRDCVIFSRPYFNTWPAHGIYVETVNGSGASGNQITGNKIYYQSTYGPTKAGHYGIYWAAGGASGSNFIGNNEVGGFDYGINLLTGTVRNIVNGNNIDSCNVGINNNASLNEVSGNVFTNNTTDLVQSGGNSRVTNNYFSVAPTFANTDIVANNYGATKTFTPVLTFGGGSTGITYTNNSGRFEQNGKTVTAYYNITLSSKGSSTGTAELALPTTCSGNQSVGQVWIVANGGTVIGPVLGYANPSNDKFTMVMLNAGSNYATTLMTDAAFTNTTELMVTVTYEA